MKPVAALVAAGFMLFGVASSEASAAPRRKAVPPDPCPREGTQAAVFTQALGGGGFKAADGSEIHLAGISMPATDGGAAALRALLAGKTLSIAPAVEGRDRYGRRLGQVFADGVWVQGALLRQGAALAAPDIASAPCGRDLLASESEARMAGAGQWGAGSFSVLDIDGVARTAKARAGTFQIVEGVVVTASVIKGRAYLNFGDDWKSDFSVTVAPADMKGFRKVRFDPRTLAGRRVRVRGWLELFNGPEFSIAVPSAIEIVK